MSARLVVRADSSTTIGSGHALRCLAIAQAWRDLGGDAVFVSARMAPSIAERLRADSIEVVSTATVVGSPADAQFTANIVQETGAVAVVTDGYALGRPFTCALSDLAAVPQLHLDDDNARELEAGTYLLDSNPSSHASIYGGFRGELLLGARYLPFRRDVTRHRARDVAKRPGRIVLTLGGSDATSTLSMLIRALTSQRTPADRWRLSVLLGGCANHERSLRAIHAEPYIDWHDTVREVGALFADADLVLSGAGSTTWELAYLGVPSMVAALADNQERVGETAAELGCTMYLGRVERLRYDVVSSEIRELLDDESRRAAMQRAGRAAVDGVGATRIARLLASPPPPGTGARVR